MKEFNLEYMVGLILVRVLLFEALGNIIVREYDPANLPVNFRAGALWKAKYFLHYLV